MGTMASRPLGRFAIAAFILLWILFAFNFIGSGYEDDKWYSQPVDKLKQWTSNYTEALSSLHETPEGDDDGVPISYQLDVPPKAGCEDLVGGLQLRLIEEYSKLLKGIRHVNMWGYLGGSHVTLNCLYNTDILQRRRTKAMQQFGPLNRCF